MKFNKPENVILHNNISRISRQFHITKDRINEDMELFFCLSAIKTKILLI